MRVGYCRDLPGLAADEQRRRLLADGCGSVVSGGIASLLGALGPGDVAAVASLSALGSKPASAVKAALEVEARGAGLAVLDQGIDTTWEEHRLFFRHAAAVAGVGADRPKAAAHSGGKPKTDPSALAKAVGMYQSGEYKMSEIVEATGVSKSTLYRNLPKGDGHG